MAVDVDNSEAIKAIVAIRDAVSDASLAAFLDLEVNDWMHDRMQQRFDMEGDEMSGPWAPLAAATADIRERLGYPPEHPINQRTGQFVQWMLQRGMVSLGNAGPEWLFPSDPVGNAAGLEQKLEAAQGLKPNTPARPVLGMDGIDLAAVTEMLGEWFLAVTAEHGVNFQ